MMFYALIGEDAPGTLDTRMAVRAAHLDRLNALKDENSLSSPQMDLNRSS